MKNLFVDVHVLQSVPPSCLNRDDTNSPKTAIYGGARRARVSSQSWKRAMRLMFKEYFDPSELSMRTKYVFSFVADEIQKMSPELSREEALRKAELALADIGLKPSTKKGKEKDSEKGKESESDVLFFMSKQQARNIAALALGEVDKKALKKALKEGNGVDIALFGRMVADDVTLNCEASAQVAHAISTHRVENEYDFFTAVDDFASEMQDHAGGGHLGTVEYNSATLYRYATLAAHKLYIELANDPAALEKAIREFVRAFICSIPTGKQNTFAAHTVPDAVLVTIRSDRPLSLAGAFEKPVSGEGLAERSAKALETYAIDAYEDFCIKPDASYIVGRYLEKLGNRMPLDEMLKRVSQDAAARVTS